MAKSIEIEESVCLYRFFDRDDELLYVGQSIDPFRRCEEHMMYATWFHDVAMVKIERFEGRAAALDAEYEAIKTEKPKHNVWSGRVPKA